MKEKKSLAHEQLPELVEAEDENGAGHGQHEELEGHRPRAEYHVEEGQEDGDQ